MPRLAATPVAHQVGRDPEKPRTCGFRVRLEAARLPVRREEHVVGDLIGVPGCQRRATYRCTTSTWRRRKRSKHSGSSTRSRSSLSVSITPYWSPPHRIVSPDVGACVRADGPPAVSARVLILPLVTVHAAPVTTDGPTDPMRPPHPDHRTPYDRATMVPPRERTNQSSPNRDHRRAGVPGCRRCRRHLPSRGVRESRLSHGEGARHRRTRADGPTR